MGINAIVGQSGGPTCVINSSLAGVFSACRKHGVQHVYGMRHGVQGLLKDDVVNLTDVLSAPGQLTLLRHTPASYLGSCRYKLPESDQMEAVYQEIFDVLRRYDIGYFFYIGGNDSMDTILKLSDYAAKVGSDIRFIGVPKTIDNDLTHTDHTPGYGSAAKYIGTTIKELVRDSTIYDLKSVTIVEIMGRNAGWLTAAAALAEDGTVRLVDAKNRVVGQEIRIPAKRRRRWKKPLTWAACVAVLCGMATTGVYAAYEPYASVSVVGGTDSVEYTVNRFNQVLGTRVSGREQPPDSKIPRFVHIDKAVEHTVRQEAKEGESVSITVTSRSSGYAERLREHIDDRFRQSGDERNPPEVRVQPPQDTGNAPEESRQSESAEQA